MAKQAIHCHLILENKKKNWSFLGTGALWITIQNLYSDPASSFYSAVVQDSQQSQQDLIIQKNGKVKLIFNTCCLCVYRLSAMIEKFNAPPGSPSPCLPWHPEPDMDAILATATGRAVHALGQSLTSGSAQSGNAFQILPEFALKFITFILP